ncbi:MAG: DUF2252 domain-containing protein, partial [Cyanobacteria bacterium K_DeepCast_35m_m2_023]|nr:DUF2252 domain-containing protein [Cyanobacteria bacterium K_DeepCast_35m_m2_023]
RLPWLLDERRRRMADSPFAFFRGAAAVMAADLAATPHSGQIVQLCGDAHLLNFGFYGSPERNLLFDINDFDETHPGPFEWDLQRLAASLVLAARSLGLAQKQQLKAVRQAVRAYRKAISGFAAMDVIPMWVWRPDLPRLIADNPSRCLRHHLNDVVARALKRNSRQAAGKLCESDGAGGLRIRHDPPLVWRFAELDEQWHGGVPLQEWIDFVQGGYHSTIRQEMRHLLSQFDLVDTAIKAVGVGSVGTRCAIGLFVGRQSGELLLQQSKQAEASVLAPYLPNPDGPEHQGERVVQGQRLMQTASDPFLGWTTNLDGQHFYRRHFRDWKGAVDVSCLDAEALGEYGKLCARTLAKAHARSGDRLALAAHLEGDTGLVDTLQEQALRHADLAEHDHRLLVGAAAAVMQ